MKRLILASLSILLMSAAIAPTVRAEARILGTPSNPATNPAEDLGSRIAPGTPGAPTTSSGRTLQEARPFGGSKMLQETPSVRRRGTAILGTPLNPAANPAADPGSRLTPNTPGAPRVSQ